MSLQTWLHQQTCRGLTHRIRVNDVLEASTRRKRRNFRTSASHLHIKRPHRDVYTLNPEEFVAKGQERVFFSGMTNPTIHVDVMEYDDAPNTTVQLAYELESLSGGKRQAWPESAKGFLYYFSPPHRPSIAGELRVRVTPSDDPMTFAEGKDLQLSTKQLWARPLYSLAKNIHLRPLYDRLLEDGLVSADLDAALQKLPTLTLMYSRSQVLHSLQDTFLVDLSADWQTIMVITEEGVAPMVLLKYFRDHRLACSPYKGVMLARFEPYGLESVDPHEDELESDNDDGDESVPQKRMVALRFLKEVVPVECVRPSYDYYIEAPNAGDLFIKKFHSVRRPWSIDIDNPMRGKMMSEGLKLLWPSTQKSAG